MSVLCCLIQDATYIQSLIAPLLSSNSFGKMYQRKCARLTFPEYCNIMPFPTCFVLYSITWIPNKRNQGYTTLVTSNVPTAYTPWSHMATNGCPNRIKAIFSSYYHIKFPTFAPVYIPVPTCMCDPSWSNFTVYVTGRTGVTWKLLGKHGVLISITLISLTAKDYTCTKTVPPSPLPLRSFWCRSTTK